MRDKTERRVLFAVSVDTEEDNWLPAAEGWSVENIRELPVVTERLRLIGLRPTYFTTYAVASIPWAADIVRDLAADGAGEIGAHVHPWNTPPLGAPRTEGSTMLKNLPFDVQKQKIVTLTDLLAARIGTRPTAFRAGRFGLGGDTVRAIAECGYRVDSSVTPFFNWTGDDHGPNFVMAPLHVYNVAPGEDPLQIAAAGAVYEVPISAGYRGLSFDSWRRMDARLRSAAWRRLRIPGLAARLGIARRVILSPETNSLSDLVSVARGLIKGGVRHLHLFLHSSSLRPGLTPFTRSRRDCERLVERIERFVDVMGRHADLVPATVSEVALGLPARDAGPERATPRVARSQRAIIVSYHYPPDPVMGSQRWGGLSTQLVRRGWEVHVVTAGRERTSEVHHGVQVERIRRRTTLNDVYRHIVGADERDGSTGDAKSERAGAPSIGWAPVRFLRREVSALFAFPDQSRGWIFGAAAATRRLVRAYEPDVVLSSGPPHSAHLAARLATLGTAVPVLADLRDPWMDQSQAWRRDAVAGQRITRRLSSWLERFCLGRCDAIVANTKELQAVLQRKYPSISIPWIPNAAHLPEHPARLVERLPGLSVTYAGTLYGGRDLSPVLSALQLIARRQSDSIDGDVTLRVAGFVAPEHAQRLAGQLRDRRAEGMVQILGVLPREEALEVTRRSAVNLVLAQQQEMQVPGKLYELAAMDVGIVVLTEPASATACEAARLGLTTADPANVETLAEAILAEAHREPGEIAAQRPLVRYQDLVEQVERVLLEAVESKTRVSRRLRSPVRRRWAPLVGPTGHGTRPVATGARRASLAVLHVDYSVGFGGATKSVSLVGHALRDVEQFVVTCQEEHVIQTWYEGMRVFRFRRVANYRTYGRVSVWLNRRLGDGVLYGACRKLIAGVDLMVSAWNTVRMVALIRRHRINCVHLSNGYVPLEGMAAPWLARVPCLVHLRGMATEGHGGMHRYALRWVSHTIAVSNAVADTVRQHLGLRNVTTIYDPADLARFDATVALRGEVRRRLGFKDGHVVAGIFGRVVRWKGQLEFVQAISGAMQRNRSLRALIVGDESDGGAEYFTGVRKAIAESGCADRFVLTGYQATVEELYHACDIVVHASIEPEPFGMVVPEAMAARKPIIAAAAGGPCEVVTDGVDGLLVAPGDVPALADAILSLADDPARRRAMGERGRAKVLGAFGVEQIAWQVAAVYRRVLGEGTN